MSDASLRLAMARSQRDASIQRVQRARAARPPIDVTWRPTPLQVENDRKAANPAAVTMTKIWDLSPIQADQSWDPTPPPGVIPPPPTNTAPPLIQLFDGLAVGDQLALSVGTWTGGPTYTRQWKRDGMPIPGETGIAYTLATADIGSMIGGTVVGSNAGGSASADAAPVGPIVEAAP